MAIIRWILGMLILSINWLTTPRGVKRSDGDQAAIDSQTSALTLYQYKACPFCVKVRRAMRRQSLNIEIRDAKRSEDAKNELLEGGGKLKVPCLRIDNGQGQAQWMYESGEIIEYLQSSFGMNQPNTVATTS